MSHPLRVALLGWMLAFAGSAAAAPVPDSSWPPSDSGIGSFRLPDRPGAFTGVPDPRAILGEDAFAPAGVAKGPRPVYPNGDAYFLIGDITDRWARQEWQRFYNVTRRMLKNGYRVVVHPFPTVRQIRAVVQNPETSVIVWSGHGSERGRIFAGNTSLPKDIFTLGASKRLRYVVISACYGDAVAEHYPMPEDVTLKHWTGVTDTGQFFHYLNSSQFPPTR